MAVNNCEICGKAFSNISPRTFVQNHTVCKSCKAKIESAGSFEKLKETLENEKAEQIKKAEEAKKERLAAAEAAAKEASKSGIEKLIFSLDGNRGRHMAVYPNKCVITTTATVGSVVSGNATDGEKTIYYIDVTGLQYKAPGLLIGYIQFETCSGQMNNLKDNFFSENTFTFGDPVVDKITEEDFKPVLEYIKYRIDVIKQAKIKQLFAPTISPADEILKYKNLLDINAITPEEYETKKKQLLNL